MAKIILEVLSQEHIRNNPQTAKCRTIAAAPASCDDAEPESDIDVPSNTSAYGGVSSDGFCTPAKEPKEKKTEKSKTEKSNRAKAEQCVASMLELLMFTNPGVQEQQDLHVHACCQSEH